MCLYSPCTDGFAPPVMMPPGIMMPPAMMTPHGMMPIYGAPPAFGPGVASYGPALGKTGGRAGKEFGAGPGKEGVHPESAETKAAVESAARGFIPESASDCLDRAVELMSHAFAKDTYIDPGKFMDDVMTRLKHKKTKDAVRESFSAAAEKLLALRKGADFKALWRQVEIAYADKETSDRVLADMLKDNPTVLAAALASDRGKSLKHACVQEAVSEARPMLNLMVGVLSKHVSVAAWNDEVRPIAEDLKTIFGKPGLFCGIATAQKEYKEAEAMRMQMAMGTIRPPVVAPVLVERKDGGTDAVQHLSLYGKPRSTPGCRCETSHCLKLFCTCFRNDVRCNSACSCLDCFNDGKHEDQRKQSVAAYRKEKEKKIHKGLDLGTAKMCAFLAQQNAQKEAGEKLKKEKIKRNRKNYTSEQVRLARKFVSEYMDTFRQQTGPKAVTFDSWVATAAGRPVASGSVYAAGGGWNGAGGGGVSSAGGSVGTVGGPAGLHPALVEPLRAGHGPVVAGPGLGVGGAEGGSGGSSMERERERSGAEGRQIVHRPYEHPKRGTFEHEAVWAKFGLLVGEVEDRAINLWERAFRELREERLQQQFDVPDHDRDAPDERQRSGGTSPNGRLVPDAVTHADLSHGMRDASIVPPDGEQAQQAPVAPPVVESQGIHGVGSPPPPPPPPVRPQD